MGISVSLIDGPLERPRISFPLEGATGVIVEFFGVVRGCERGRSIVALDYEAYRAMAQKELERIAEEVGDRGLCHELVLIHRIGRVPVGEPSLYLRVSAERRGTAFRIAEEVIRRLKTDVPIWKAAVDAEADPKAAETVRESGSSRFRAPS